MDMYYRKVSNGMIGMLIQDNKLYFALNFDAVIRLISQSKILIMNTGNVAFFLALYRLHAENMYQFDRNGRLVEPSVRS